MAIFLTDKLKIVVTLGMPGASIAQNVFYAQYETAASAEEEDVVDDMAAWVADMYANILSILVDLVDINEISVSKRTGAAPVTYEEIGSIAGVQTGAVASDMVAHGVAMVMRVATTGVRSVARKYIPGIAEASKEDLNWTAGALAAGVLFLADWVAGPASVDGRNYTAGIVQVPSGDFQPFRLAGILSSIPGYQRRRKPGVGV